MVSFGWHCARRRWVIACGCSTWKQAAASQDGKPAFTYNLVGLQVYTINASEKLPAGKSVVTMSFAYDGNGRGKGGTAMLSINDKKVGTVRVERTEPNIFSADDAADVGVDEGTNVSKAYKPIANKLTAKIDKIKIDIQPY